MTSSLLQSLIEFIKKNDVDNVRSMIEANPFLCSADAQVRKGDNPLHFAARLGLDEMTSTLLRYCMVNAANNDGKTALHEAAAHGHPDIVRILLNGKAEVNCLKAADWTPLMMACAKSHLVVIRVLLEAGASLSRVNKDGWSAFHIAAREGDVKVLNLLLDADSQCWKTQSKNGRSPLHSAVIHGRYECTELLLSDRCGYEVDAQDSCGSTPLMDALRKGYEDVATLLIQHGSSPTAQNSLGRNCFHIVAEAGEVSSLMFLKTHFKGNVETFLNQPDSRESTCLHLAAKEGHANMIEALLDLGADYCQTDAMGRTALTVASLCKKTSCVTILDNWCGTSEKL